MFRRNVARLAKIAFKIVKRRVVLAIVQWVAGAAAEEQFPLSPADGGELHAVEVAEEIVWGAIRFAGQQGEKVFAVNCTVGRKLRTRKRCEGRKPEEGSPIGLSGQWIFTHLR